MAKKGLTGVVCDAQLNRVICIVGSDFHEKMGMNDLESTKTVYLPNYRLRGFCTSLMDISYLKNHMIRE